MLNLNLGIGNRILNRNNSLSGPIDPYLALIPVAYFNANNIGQSDGTEVTQWNDLSGNGYNLLPVNGLPPTFDNSSGFNQVVFDGIDDLLKMEANHAALDFDTDGSDYTIIFHTGNVTPTIFSSFFFFKGDYNAADRQFSLSTNSSGTNMTLNVGGATQNVVEYRTLLPDDFIVIRRNGGNVSMYANDAELHNFVPGTSGVPASNPWSIGARFNNQLFMDCSFRKVVFYNNAIPLATLTELYNSRETD